jgi:hypothetical protein
MSDMYEQATIQPFFPANVVEDHKDHLLNLGVSISDGENFAPGVTAKYLYIEDGCWDWDELHSVLQQMLDEAGMDYCCVEGCFSCSKMLPGEFGGFAHFITVEGIQHMGTGGWVSEKEKLFLKKKNNKDFMPMNEAMQIVYDLAEQNCLDERSSDEDLQRESLKQQTALATVHDFIVNNLGDN